MIRPRLLLVYRTKNTRLLGSGAGVIDRTGPVPRLLVRTEQGLAAHDITAEGARSADPAAFFAGRARGRPIIGTGPVAPDLSHAVLVDETSYRLVSRDGTLLWERPCAGPAGNPVRYVRWVKPAGAEPRVWLAVPPDPAAAGGADPRGAVDLALLSVAGDELDRLTVPVGGRQRSVDLALRPDARPLAVGLRVAARAMTFRVGPGGAVSHAADRALLDGDPSGSGFVTIGPSDSGDTTDVRWHSARGKDTATVVTCADVFASEQQSEPVHIAPYLSGGSGGHLSDDLLLLGLEDDYDEIETELFGAERWRPSSHWLVSSGRPLGMVAYPEESHLDDLTPAVPFGDGTWLTHGRDVIYRWGLDR
ncbi:hypothetical protein [Actinomadura sp. NPDC049753]|uniref:hypothetical protein n=1 Tax=Actinomadura sp. NPDC049753 TaxID=3154739 RepID=UPI00343343B7